MTVGKFGIVIPPGKLGMVIEEIVGMVGILTGIDGIVTGKDGISGIENCFIGLVITVANKLLKFNQLLNQ